jgi:hypothetical protein
LEIGQRPPQEASKTTKKHSQQQNNKRTKINSVVEPTQQDSNKPTKPGEEE